MHVFLTGASGYIGSAVLRALIAHDHTVTAVLRSDEKAARAREAGATAVVGDLTDLALVARLAAQADAVVHTASAEDVDPDFIATVLTTLDGTEKPFVHTGGIFTFGASGDITEDVTRRPAGPHRVAGSERGSRPRRAPCARPSSRPASSTATAPASRRCSSPASDAPTRSVWSVTARSAGRPCTWTTWPSSTSSRRARRPGRVPRRSVRPQPDGPRTGAGRRRGTAWCRGTARQRRTPGSAASVVAESADESRARLGTDFADALLLDQAATGAYARSLGWQPSRPTLVEELRSGYRAD